MPTDLALLRLVAQHVAGPGLDGPVAAARHLLAAQGQDAAGVIRSLALRSRARSGQEVVDAYDAGTLVRSWPMRGTLHALAAEDLGWLLALATARPRAAGARRRSQLGLAESDVATAQRVSERLAAGGLVREELLAAFRAAGLPTDAGRGYHLVVELAQRGVLCLGPIRSGEQALILAEAWIGPRRTGDEEEAAAELALRYFVGHGPATVPDLARWAGLPRTTVRSGLAAVRDRLERWEVDGTEYWLDPSLPEQLAEHRAEARRMHLLPGFDEMVLGYADRTATVPAVHARLVVPGNNGMFRGTVLADGVAIGTWRRGRTGIDVSPFAALSAEEERQVALAVDRLP